jgi:uncharacterized protein YciI
MEWPRHHDRDGDKTFVDPYAQPVSLGVFREESPPRSGTSRAAAEPASTMEVTMIFRHSVALGTVALVALTTPSMIAPAATQADFNCARRVVAIYRPGPNWSQFKERLSDHLDYVKAQMDAKTMVYGSPLSDQSGQPIGGLFVYDVPNLDDVEQRVQADTFVKSQVVSYSVAFWGMCQRQAAAH